MRRKWIIIIQVLIILTITIFIVAGVSSNKSAQERISHLPSVTFNLMYGQDYNLQNVRANSSVLIIYFSPDCDHCQQQAAAIRQKKEALANTSVIMITQADSAATRKFAVEYELANMKNVLFLQDSDSRFYHTFHLASTPSLVIYNRQHMLVKKIEREVAMDYIIKLLNE